MQVIVAHADQTCDAACNNVGGRALAGAPSGSPIHSHASSHDRASAAAAGGATHLLPGAECTTRAEERRREGRGLTACLVLACSVCLEYVYLTSARAYGGMGRVGQALAGLRYGGMPRRGERAPTIRFPPRNRKPGGLLFIYSAAPIGAHLAHDRTSCACATW